MSKKGDAAIEAAGDAAHEAYKLNGGNFTDAARAAIRAYLEALPDHVILQRGTLGDGVWTYLRKLNPPPPGLEES